MQAAIQREKLSRRPPDIHVRPDIRDIRVLKFHKAEQVYRQARGARDSLRRELGRRL